MNKFAETARAFQRAIRTVDRTPMEQRATPTSEEIVYDYVAGKAAREEAAKRFAQLQALKKKRLRTDVALAEEDMAGTESRTLSDLAHKKAMLKQRLTEGGRQADKSIAFDKATLNAAEGEDQAAQKIEYGNLALEGLGAVARAQQVKKQMKMTEDLIQHTKDLGTLKGRLYQEILGIMEKRKNIYEG